MGRKTFYIFLFSATCHAVIFPANRISPRNSPGEEVIGYRVVTPQQIQQELSERPRLGFEELQVERQSPPPEYSAEDVRRNNQRRNIFVKTRIPEVLHFAEDAEQMEAVNQFIQESDEINMHYRVLNIEPFIDTLATLANNTKKKLLCKTTRVFQQGEHALREEKIFTLNPAQIENYIIPSQCYMHCAIAKSTWWNNFLMKIGVFCIGEQRNYLTAGRSICMATNDNRQPQLVFDNYSEMRGVIKKVIILNLLRDRATIANMKPDGTATCLDYIDSVRYIPFPCINGFDCNITSNGSRITLLAINVPRFSRLIERNGAVSLEEINPYQLMEESVQV